MKKYFFGRNIPFQHERQIPKAIECLIKWKNEFLNSYPALSLYDQQYTIRFFAPDSQGTLVQVNDVWLRLCLEGLENCENLPPELLGNECLK